MCMDINELVQQIFQQKKKHDELYLENLRRWALDASSPDPTGAYVLVSHSSVMYCLRFCRPRNDWRWDGFMAAAIIAAPPTATEVAPQVPRATHYE